MNNQKKKKKPTHGKSIHNEKSVVYKDIKYKNHHEVQTSCYFPFFPFFFYHQNNAAFVRRIKNSEIFVKDNHPDIDS